MIEITGFREVARLGSGGVGDVYRAVRISTGSPVAIKLLRDWSDRDVALQRAERELRALVGLQGHPHVIHVEEVISVHGAVAIVMEFAPGGSVRDLMDAHGGALDFGEVVLVGGQVASALAASHERGIIHRDIKPLNLLIGAFGQVKVCDFGIAAMVRGDRLEMTDAFSFRYASPEELRGDPDITPATDIFSLGATLVHALTGRYLDPQQFTSAPDAIAGWTPPEDLPADTSTAFVDLLRRSVDPDAWARPTARELVGDFEALSLQLGPDRRRSLPLAPPAIPPTVPPPIPPPISPLTSPLIPTAADRRTAAEDDTSPRTSTAATVIRPRSTVAVPPPPVEPAIPPPPPPPPTPPPTPTPPQRPQQRTRSVPIGRAVLGGSLALLLVGGTIAVAGLRNGGPDDAGAGAPPSSATAPPSTAPPATTTPTDTAAPATTEPNDTDTEPNDTDTDTGVTDPPPVPDTECPPTDGSAEPRRDFPAAPPMCLDPDLTYTAEITTNFGDFTIELDHDQAPLTVNNFVVLARYHYFDDTICHRILPSFVIQCGDPTGSGTGGPGYTIPDELPDPGTYQLGSLAMANTGAPNTGGSQFFIITGPSGQGLPPQYSLFGQVTDGLDTTITDINAVGNPDPTANGVPPLEEVRIQTVTITES